jgi:conjugal transfer mating pair stabilization protein TraG
MFQSIAMMTGGNSGFESLMVATSLLAFMVILGVTVFKQTFTPLSGWFFGLMLVWYGLMLPKTDIIIVDQTNVTANRVVSNMPLGIAFMGNVTSSMGKWFTDKSEVVFTAINDVNYSTTGLVFGANAYKEARKTNLINYSPELQSDWTQFASNCSFYDIALYHTYTVADMQSSNDLLALMGNTNQALMTPVGGTTVYCDQAYTTLKAQTDALVGSQTFLQRFAAALNPSGTSSSSMPAQATANMLASLEASYSNMFAGVQQDAVKIITQEMMVNTVKTAALQNAQTTGDTEQMMAGIASAQAELSTVNSQNTVAVLAAKYLPIMHNLIEGIIIALFPMMLVMCVLAGWGMFTVVMGYLTTLLWVKLWPGMFAIVNGIANSVHASKSYSASFGDGGTTIKNSMEMLSTANSTQALAGWMTMLVPAISWGIIKLGNMGLQSAFAAVGGGAQKSAESAGSAVGSGNINVGNSSYNNMSANKNDRSVLYSDPGVARVQGASGWMQGSAGTEGSMRYGVTKNDLPVTSNANYQRAMEASQQASVSMERAKGLASTAQHSRQAAINSGLEFMSGMGIQDAASVMTSSSSSAQNQSSWSSMTKSGSALDAKYGLKDGTTTQIMLGANANATLQAGTAMGGNLGAGGSINDSGINVQSYMRDLGATQQSLQQSGVSFDGSVVDALQKNKQFNQSLSSGNQLAQRTVSSMGESQSAALQATDAYKESQAWSAQSRDLYSQAQSIGIDHNQAVGQAFGKGSTPLSEIGSSIGAAGLARNAAKAEADRPDFGGTRFEPPQNAVPIEPPKGGKAGVERSYRNAAADVDQFNAQNQGQVQGKADGAGLSEIGGRIGDAQSSITGQYNASRNHVQGQIDSTQSQVSNRRNDMSSNFGEIANNPTTGQRFTNWATQNGDVFEEIKRGVGGVISNGASGNSYGDISPPGNGNVDYQQDPKPTASTVVVNTNQARWRK